MTATQKFGTGRSSQFVDSAGALQNSIISARKSGANIDFLSIGGGLSVTLLATATPFVYDVNGNRIKISADQAVTISDNANNFIWADDTGATGVTTLPCQYSYVAPAGATGQHWFDLGDDRMKVWNGAAFVPTDRIFIGYVRADAGTANARYACEPNLVGPSDRFNRLGDGSDGFLEVTAGTTIIDGLKQYTSVVIRGSGVVKHTSSSGLGSALEVKTQGIFFVIGTGGVDLKAIGRPAGASGAPGIGGAGGGGGLGGAGGAGGAGNSGIGGAGGSHLAGQSAVTTGGGTGTVGLGNPGSGNGLSTTGFGSPVLFGVGNGGGAGTGGGGDFGFGGGNGGGAIMLEAASIAIGTGAIMRADGDPGVSVDNPARISGAGGGGGGGSMLLFSRVFQNDSSLTATGGVGGTGGTPPGFGGGAGAAGTALHLYN